MAGEVRITVVGNAVADPEVKFTPSGRAVCSLQIAVTERRNSGGTWEDVGSSFYKVQAWGPLAENIAESISKGARVIATGELRQRQYENKDGEPRSVWELTADEVGPSLKFATATVERVRRNTSADAAPAAPHLQPVNGKHAAAV